MKKQITALATKYQIKPEYIEAIEESYDFINRFSFIKSEEQLNNCVMEIRNNKKAIYKNIPNRTRDVVLKSLKKYGANGTSKFYSDQMKKAKLDEFVKVVIENRIQPREFFEDGVITYKNLMYANAEDQTSTSVFYGENRDDN